MLPILPAAPSRTDPANFSAEADDWLAALPAWTDAVNAIEGSLQASTLIGTSTTSLSVGTGSKGFTTQAGKAWLVGSYVFIVATSDRSRVMQGKVTAYNSGTGSLVVDVNIASGSGTYTSWDIGIANPSIGATSGINVAGDVTVSGGGIGYGPGSGASVTQATSKTTGVTLNKPSGQITMNAAALAANTSVSFAVSCSALNANDVVVINLKSGFASNAAYQVWINDISSGQFVVNLRNISAGSLSEAVVLSYVIIRGSTT